MADKRYMVHRPDGTQDGPYSWDQMYDLALRGELRPGTEVSDAATGERGRADSIPGIRSGTAELVQAPGSLDRLVGMITLANALFVGVLWIMDYQKGPDAYGLFGSIDAAGFLLIGARSAALIGGGAYLLKQQRVGHVLIIATTLFGSWSVPARVGQPWASVATTTLEFLIFVYSCLRMTGCLGDPPRR